MAKKQLVELLSPAGDLKKMQFAFLYGADAVYCGLPAFSLRAKTGFDLGGLEKAIDYVKKNKKKVYVTINIFAHEKHIKALPEYLKKLAKIKPHALIISDPGIIHLAQKYCPQIAIHLSTQANTINSEAVKFWKKMGVNRVILGRETSLKDIQAIHKAVPKMELEIFVHGAMCLSYSGRCYLSSWLNNRSGNEGLCTQPCRWDYKVKLEEKLRPGEFLEVENDDKGTYILNSKDLCLFDYLSELIKAGVISFKIEGRTKSHYYVASITNAYRQAIDILLDPKIKNKQKLLAKAREELFKVDHRGYTTGFLLGNEAETREDFETSKAFTDWELVGEVVKIKKEASGIHAYIKVHNTLLANEKIEILTPENLYTLRLHIITNAKGEDITEAHGGTEEVFSVLLPADYVIIEGSLLRKKK
ncbi:MAG: U32 family peptidase C-terminal domain-containing protein [bacterium]